MRILHTSDWHIGRTFHGHRTLEPLSAVMAALCEEVRRLEIDVVVASGDIFDASTPSAEAFDILDTFLIDIRAAGAEIVFISGNHDSASRLGARAAFASGAGVHVLTRPETLAVPVTIRGVHFYGIPFLEPAVMRTTLWQGVTPMRSQKDALGHAMSLIEEDLQSRPGPSVVLAHTFVAGASGESCDSERDIVVGGVDQVPVSTFESVTYAALGHIHGRSTLAHNVRYSGAPLHYSFSEADKPRGGWVVEISDRLESVEWLDLPVPRALRRLSGTLDDLLTSDAHAAHEDSWIDATLTDTTRPMDAMAKLRARFPWCAHLDWEPSVVAPRTSSIRELIAQAKSDEEIVDAFLERVRNGEGTTVDERPFIEDMVALQRAKDGAK